MRLTPIALSLAIAAATMASAGFGQRPDDQIDPRSAALVEQARQLERRRPAQRRDRPARDRARRRSAQPRAPISRSAGVAQAQRLPGKAIRLYGDALRLEPNDVNALTGQGEAYVQRGADRARARQSRPGTDPVRARPARRRSSSPPRSSAARPPTCSPPSAPSGPAREARRRAATRRRQRQGPIAGKIDKADTCGRG